MLFVPRQDAAFIGETVSNAGKIPEDSIYIPLSTNDARTVVISPTKIEIATVLQAQDGLVIMIDNQGALRRCLSYTPLITRQGNETYYGVRRQTNRGWSTVIGKGSGKGSTAA